jgi:putative membrane protein
MSFVAVMLTTGTVFSGCSMVQRAMPGVTMSNANVFAVLDTIDRSEIAAAQLAGEKASSEQVKAFASRIIHEHATMMQDTHQLAQRMDLQSEQPSLASTMEALHREMMKKLEGKSGRDFDDAYLEYEIKVHEQAIYLVQDMADSPDDPRLRQRLRQTRPDLQSHWSAARAAERRLAAQR